jgi:hypothetical protein
MSCPLAYIRHHLGSFDIAGVREKLQKLWKFSKPTKELIDQILRFSTSFVRCSARLSSRESVRARCCDLVMVLE